MKCAVITLILLTAAILPVSCQSTNKKINKMEMKKKLIDSLKNYSEKRVYYANVDKGGCRVEITVNDMLFNNYFTEWGATGTIPMNLSILKSGKQKVKVKIFPDANNESLTDITRLQITITYSHTPTSSLEEQVVVLDWNLPQEIIAKRLPVYETILEFDAVVPYDYTYRINGAVDLRTIPNIEQLAFNKMKEIRQLYEKGDVETYWRMVFAKYSQYANSLYQTPEEISEDLKDDIKIFAPHKNRKFSSIDNYDFFFFAEGKTVMVLDRDTRESVLKCSYTDEQGFECEDELTIILYMPKDSNELEIY